MKSLALVWDYPHSKQFPDVVRPHLVKALDDILDEHRDSFFERGTLPSNSGPLLGRERELAALDKALDETSTSVLVFVAWGGMGKTALVNNWLNRLEGRGLARPRAYCHSFYSQGVKRSATSADVFMKNALIRFGDPECAHSAVHPWDKGQRLAELIQQHPTVLVLDGLEPLQSGMEPLRGELTAPSLQSLLIALLNDNPGLCVVTSREHLVGFDKHAPRIIQYELDYLKSETSRELLQLSEIKGSDSVLDGVAERFQNHALAIHLLRHYLRMTPSRKASQAYSIPLLNMPDKDGRPARSVLEAFLTELSGSPDSEVLNLLGFFDRPASVTELEALRCSPAIPGLTGQISDLGIAAWNQVIQRLRERGLVAAESSHNPGGLDAHPIIRQHMSERLETSAPVAFRKGHRILYEHLRDSAPELPESLESMQPLFLAVSHGCKAGLHANVLEEVFRRRIKRHDADFAAKTLGANGAELAAVSSFFLDTTYTDLPSVFSTEQKTFLFREAGFDLGVLGRIEAAIGPTTRALKMATTEKDWVTAATTSSTLAQLFLLLGRISEGRVIIEKGVGYADASNNEWERATKRSYEGHVLCQLGQFEEAEGVFTEAEKIQRYADTHRPLLHGGLWGYWFGDYLLDRGENQLVIQRAQRTFEWVRADRLLLPQGADLLLLGRAWMAISARQDANALETAMQYLQKAVHMLRSSGHRDFLPVALMARARAQVFRSDYRSAIRDLNEADEIIDHIRSPALASDLDIECCRLILTHSDVRRAMVEPDRNFVSQGPLVSLLRSDPVSAAEHHLEKAVLAVDNMDYGRRRPETTFLRAQLAAVRGDDTEARQLALLAKQEADSIGRVDLQQEIETLQSRIGES